MKTAKLNLKLLCVQFTDVLYPRLRLSITERAVYFYLLRHTRLEGKLQLHCSMPWIARGIGISTGPVREAVRRLVALGALRLVQRSKAGHVLEVRLPDEIPATRPSTSGADDPAAASFAGNLDPLANPLPPLDLEKLDFLKTRALRNSIHLRARGHCFYCLRRTDAHTQCLDHVQPRVKAGCNSYRNLVSCCLECNSEKGERSASDFLRSLYRDRRLTASEFHAALRRLDALLAGKLPPPVHHPDTPIGTSYRSSHVGVGALVQPEPRRAPTSKPPHTKDCHSEPACGGRRSEESLCPSSRTSHFIGRKGRPRRALPL